MGNKVLNSTIENAYKLYEGNDIIDYNINRQKKEQDFPTLFYLNLNHI